MKTATRKPYNPGTKGEIISKGNAIYTVQSFRNREETYSVDLNAGSCTCPDHINRGRECKHLKTCRYEAYKTARETARGLDLDTLKNLLLFKSYRPEIREAMDYVIWEREAGAAIIGELSTL